MKKNACIVSFYMENIDQKTVLLQKAVVEKYNRASFPHYIQKTALSHADSIDWMWSINGQETGKFLNQNIAQQIDHDIFLFLDIDAIPLSADAIDFYVETASEGKIIGNAQRSNHIDNGQHVFAAPSALALSKDTFKKIGRPSASETLRSDVAEEYTWCAELHAVAVETVMPLRFDAVPQRYEWERESPPYWALADGMPVYGMGTTYGKDERCMFYHNFQIRMPGQEERFWKKCELVLIT